MGNIINRVFDSSGPEGKVRGTPQQIIEKYQILARDAQLSNDRVAAENFMQHAEHYTRMLAEAQRELAAEQEQRRPQGDYGNQNGNQNGNQPYQQNGQHGQQGGYQGGQPNPPRDPQPREPQRDRPYRDERSELRDEQPEVTMPRSTGLMDFIDDLGDSGLVETPEARHRPNLPRNAGQERRDRGPRPEGGEQGDRQERRREDRKPREGQAARGRRARRAGQPARGRAGAPQTPCSAQAAPRGEDARRRRSGGSGRVTR